MGIQYTPEERIIITSIMNFSVQLSLNHHAFNEKEEFKEMLKSTPGIDGEFIFGVLKNCGFSNEGALPPLLYSFLVYPREAIKKADYQTYDDAMKSINLKMELEKLKLIDSENRYKISVDRSDYKKTKDMLRHIRNAVSHGGLEFDGYNFIFTDINPNNQKTIIFKIPKESIDILIKDLYNALLLIIKDIQARYPLRSY